MDNFIATAAARETDIEIMQAIAALARSQAEAERIWEDASYEEALAVWERVTGNGQRDSTDYCWGASGSNWAAGFGLEG